MTMLSMMTRAGRATALILVFAGPTLVTAAHAFDPFGGDETVVLKSAQSARYRDPAAAPLAQATAAARSRIVAANPPATVSDAATAAGKTDLLGEGGGQDELAREIYHPGSGTDW